MVKVMCFAVVLFFAFCAVVPVSAQQQAAVDLTAVVKGEVVSVDAANSAVVVKQTIDAAVNAVSENVTLTVVSETKVVKGDVSLKLADLKAGDKVEAKVVKDKDILKVQEIAVK